MHVFIIAMAGRGRGRGGGGAQTAAAHAPEGQAAISKSGDGNGAGGTTDIHHCGMCGLNVGNDTIGCDKCSTWFHPTEMCSGLPNDVIKAIFSVNGDAIRFVCTNCRVKPPSSSGVSTRQGRETAGANFPDQLIQQLFLSVKGICTAVMELTERMDRAFSEQQARAPTASQSRPQTSSQHTNPDLTNPRNPDPANAPGGDYRSVIRQEMREMQERAKRRQSVIIKGIQARSAADFISKFGDLSESFAGTRVELSGVTPIPNHSDLFRAKILDDDHRRLVLDRAKTLKDTENDNVFIRRDLTFAQRKELRERRAQRNGEGAVHTENSETHNSPGPSN